MHNNRRDISDFSKDTKIGVFSLSTGLQLLLMGLKLFGVITFDWVWVLAPTWAPILAIKALLLFAFVVWVIEGIFKKN